MPEHTPREFMVARQRLVRASGFPAIAWQAVQADDYGDRDEVRGVIVEPRDLRVFINEFLAYKDELDRLAALLGCPDDPFSVWDRVNAGVQEGGLVAVRVPHDPQ